MEPVPVQPLAARSPATWSSVTAPAGTLQNSVAPHWNRENRIVTKVGDSVADAGVIVDTTRTTAMPADYDVESGRRIVPRPPARTTLCPRTWSEQRPGTAAVMRRGCSGNEKDPRNLRLVDGRSHLPPRVPRAQVLRATGPWPGGVPPRSHPRHIPEGIWREHPRVSLSTRRGGGRLLALRPVGGAPGSVPDRWSAGRPRDPPPGFPAGTSGVVPVGLAASRSHLLRCLPSRGRCSERGGLYRRSRGRSRI